MGRFLLLMLEQVTKPITQFKEKELHQSDQQIMIIARSMPELLIYRTCSEMFIYFLIIAEHKANVRKKYSFM